MPSPRSARRVVTTGVEAAGWVLLVAAACSIVARSFRTPTDLAAMLVALIPLTRVGVGVVAALAVASRRQALAGASLVVVLAFAPTVSSAAVGTDRVEPEAGRPVTIFTANVLASNPDIAAALEDIATHDTDMILLQEVTPEHAAAIDEVELDGRYPHRVYHPLPYFHGYALLSRWPIEQSASVDVGGWPIVRTQLDTPLGPIEVVNAHMPAPIAPDGHTGWQRQFEVLGQWADEASVPFVIAGDFNATTDHWELRHLIDGPLDDAWESAGTGWGATYGDPRFPLPILRLDHVLVGPEWGVVDIDTVDVPGSDHRGLVVHLVLLHTPAPA